jgi:putative ABC transport system ATP-binding protein
MAEPPIVVEGLDHFFGSGDLRKQILFDVSVTLRAGEIVIVTGPSGSGKTTLLTLVGALRSAQEGSVRVLGHELRGAAARQLEAVRMHIGYVFQSHNLIDALTARQNVEMALRVQGDLPKADVRRQASEMLEAVGLAERLDHHPEELSGGQRQRVAIARALAAEPRIVLADEPTASLDKQSGRDVVDLIQTLAREQGVTVLLVTHDNRILDIADRIVHLEDGRLQSFTEAVVANTQQMMHMLAGAYRKGELKDVVTDMPQDQFARLLEQVTADSRQFLEATQLANNEAFESMLDQALEAFTFKLGQILRVERASLFLVDRERNEIWLKVAEEEDGRPVEVRMPMGAGIAGHVATTGEPVRIDDAYADDRFNPQIDRDTGFRTRTILCLPIRDRAGQVFAVAQLLNRMDEQLFDDGDEVRFGEFMASLGVILETWWQMNRAEDVASEALA